MDNLVRDINWSQYASAIANNPSIPKQIKVSIVLGGIWLISGVIDKVGTAAKWGLVIYLIYQLFGANGREMGESVQSTMDRLEEAAQGGILMLTERNDDREGSTHENRSEDEIPVLPRRVRQLRESRRIH